jgi:hypothetical protein
MFLVACLASAVVWLRINKEKPKVAITPQVYERKHASFHQSKGTNIFAIGKVTIPKVREVTVTEAVFQILGKKNVPLRKFISELTKQFPAAQGSCRMIEVPPGRSRTFRMDYKTLKGLLHEQYFITNSKAGEIPDASYFVHLVGSKAKDGRPFVGSGAFISEVAKICLTNPFAFNCFDYNNETHFCFIAEIDQSEFKPKLISNWKVMRMDYECYSYFDWEQFKRGFGSDRQWCASLLDSPYQINGLFNSFFQGLINSGLSSWKITFGTVIDKGSTVVANVSGKSYTVPKSSGLPLMLDGTEKGRKHAVTILQPPVFASEQITVGK